MAIPNLPIVCQVNWTDADWAGMGPSPWDQPYANLLSIGVDGVPALQELHLSDTTVRRTLQPATARLVVRDPGYDLRPLRSDSVLAPHHVLHRRARILRQVGGLGTDVWEPLFFGYIRSYESDPVALSPPRTTITLESPLAVLAKRKVVLPAMENPRIWDASNPGLTALGVLLYAIGLLGTINVDLDDVGAAYIPGTWGGGTVQVAASLAEMAQIADSILWIAPQVATAAGAANWTLRWARPTFSTDPLVTWDWAAGHLASAPAPEIAFDEEAVA